MKRDLTKNPPNYALLAVILVLTFLGLTALASASSVMSLNKYGNSYYYLVHQLLYGVLPGMVLMAWLSRIDYLFWRKLAWPLMFAVFVMLLAVLMPALSLEVGGAKRWLNLGFAVFQPSEVAKLVLIIYLAAWFEKKQNNLHDFLTGFLPSLIIVGAVAALIYLQPDLGTLVVICLTAATMFFMAGSKLRHLAGTAALAVAGLFMAIKAAPYRAARIITFLDPSHDPQGIGYHVNQALLAIGSGGLLGYGYNRSLQKHNYLPEPMGDSIFAVMAEEMGFVRMAIFIILFLSIAIMGFNIARKTSDDFGKLLAVGISSWICLQAFVNIGAMLALLPLTGIPLPFISYGASSLITTLAAMGILLNMSRRTA